MDSQSIFRMVARSRLLQTCLRNVSISRRHLCVLSSIQLSSQITSTSSTIHAPNGLLNHQEMTMRPFSSYLKPTAEFPSKKSNAKKASEFLPHVIDDQEVGVRLGSHKELRQNFRLFVGGLSKETSVEALREYFSKFGELTQCNVKFDRQTGQSRGFGYVAFSSQKEVRSLKIVK
ncbi:RNA recognition motif domain-containing protein [Ditylenchus destructor]|nr:RNA recognition motif domain-containing protein [Ditylenchus destructor]